MVSRTAQTILFVVPTGYVYQNLLTPLITGVRGIAWAGIWNLKVPPKVKNLIWCMCRGCLPTRARLLDKGVTCPTNCASCDSTHEDLLHVFFACPFALQVWNRTGL